MKWKAWRLGYLIEKGFFFETSAEETFIGRVG
jgi:hypothetical protein